MAKRPSSHLKHKINTIPVSNRQKEVTAEDFQEISEIFEAHADEIDETKDMVMAIGSGDGPIGYPTLAAALIDDPDNPGQPLVPDNAIFQVDPGDPDEGIWRRDSSDPDGAVFLREFPAEKSDLQSIIDTLNNSGIPIIGSELFKRNSFVWQNNLVINSQGKAGSTGQETSITHTAVPLNNRWKRIKVSTSLSNPAGHIATYSEKNFDSAVQVIGSSEAIDANTYVIELGEDDQFIRFTCQNSFLDSFSVKLLDVYPEDDSGGDELFIISEQYAINSATYNDDGIISAADITWQDGTEGVLTYSDYNPEWMAYDSYTVTYGDKILTQPKVTRDENGTITNQPLKTIS